MSRHFYIVLILVVALGAASFGVLYHFRQKADANDLLYIPKKEVITPEILQLQKYVQINTSNPPGNETEGARFLLAELRRHHIQGELIESAPGRGNVYARLKGARPGEGLLLLHHIDVVHAEGMEWKFPPFSARIQSNQMYGRGTLDTKGIGICHLDAFITLAESGHPIQRDVVFLATADEESGGAAGIGWLMKNRPDIFEGISNAINEGGVTETKKSEITYFGIETGSKQFVYVDLNASSRETLEKTRLALEPWFDPRDPDRILPEVTDYLHRIAPHRVEIGKLLDDLPATVAAQRFWLLPPPYRELTQNNLFMQGVRKTPAGFTLSGALFNLPDEDPEKRLAWLTAKVQPFGVTVVPVKTMGPAPISSPHTPFFALLQRSIHEQYGNVDVGPMILPRITTDCRYLRARGVQCYGMWPYPVDFYETMGIHGPNESIRLDWFVEGVGMTKRLVAGYAAGE